MLNKNKNIQRSAFDSRLKKQKKNCILAKVLLSKCLRRDASVKDFISDDFFWVRELVLRLLRKKHFVKEKSGASRLEKVLFNFFEPAFFQIIKNTKK